MNPQLVTAINETVPGSIAKLNETEKKIGDIIKWYVFWCLCAWFCFFSVQVDGTLCTIYHPPSSHNNMTLTVLTSSNLYNTIHVLNIQITSPHFTHTGVNSPMSTMTRMPRWPRPRSTPPLSSPTSPTTSMLRRSIS